MLLEDNPAQEITGIDISGKMLEVARRKLGERRNVAFVEGDASHLPFPDESFGVVVVANSLHYFDSPLLCLAEMRRVLKPGGRVFILDWCRDYLTCRACDAILAIFDPAYNNCYTQKELRDDLISSGFEVTAERRFRVGLVWGMMVATGLSRRDRGQRPIC